MKYLRRINETIESDNINWNIIEDIKDMSLEYLDMGFILGIHINSSRSIDAFYTLYYSHEMGVKKNRRNHNWGGQIYYNVFLYKHRDWIKGEGVARKETKELVDRIKEAYPGEDIRTYLCS